MRDTKEELLNMIARAKESGKLAKALGSASMVVELDLGEKEKVYHLILGNGQMRVKGGSHIKPSLVIGGKKEAWAEVVKGKKDITHFIAQGQLRAVKGNLSDGINLSRIIGALAITKR